MAGTLSWERSGDHFFRTLDGPNMQWDLRMSQVSVRSARCGGIITAWDKTEALVKRDAVSREGKAMLRIYSTEGAVIKQIKLDFGTVVDVQITIDETIVIATKSGLVRHYTEFGNNFSQLRLPTSVEDLELSSTGYVARLASPEGNENLVRFAIVTNLESSEPKYRMHVIDPKIRFQIQNWLFLPEDKETSRGPSAVLLSKNHEARLYDLQLASDGFNHSATDVPNRFGSVSPDRSKIALSEGQNQVHIYSANLERCIAQISNASTHSGIWWIGNEAIMLATNDGEAEIHSLSTASSSSSYSSTSTPLVTYFEDSELAFLQEPDGVRILGKNNHLLLLPVSQPTVDTFKLGSLAPSAILYSCVDQIDIGSPRSDQTVKLIGKEQLSTAIDTCIAAALLENEPKVQKRLMKAASFGKSMLQVYDSGAYLTAITKLRVLNALRTLSNCPLFLTSVQADVLGTANIICRLERRGLWAEAAAVAKLMRLPQEPVYVEWACWTIQNSEKLSDEELRSVLEEKLRKLECYSRSKMASRAMEQGRHDLARTLLQQEPVARDRISLLLEMNMAQPALEQAIKSGNVFLIDYVLLTLTEQLSLPQLMRIIGGNKLAVHRQAQLIESRAPTKDAVHDFLYQMDESLQSLKMEFESIKMERDSLIKIKQLRALENKFSALDKKSLDSRACADWADLLTLQRQLEETYGIQVSGKSATDTVLALLKLPQISQAQKVKTKLGISDRQFSWLRLRALIDRREFDGLWEYANVRKPPIGYRPFYDACIEAGNLEHASRYIELISEASIEEKVKMYVKVKHPEQAKELISKSRRPELLSLVNI